MKFMFGWQEQYLTSERREPSEILFLPREHKIHIFELTCNILHIHVPVVTKLRSHNILV